jgi:hypothetical protein
MSIIVLTLNACGLPGTISYPKMTVVNRGDLIPSFYGAYREESRRAETDFKQIIIQT